jgi:hypothetical protein
MKLGNLFVVNSVIACFFGLCFIFIPGRMAAQYGIAFDASFAVIGQLFGTALLGYAILTWSARKSGESDARRAIVLSLFAADAIGFVVALIAQLKGMVNSLGWSTVAIYLLLAIGFAYFYFTKPATA